jgi:tetratricopeptide (TPR) repeat protein
LEAGLAIENKLVEQFPAVPEYEQALAASHYNLGKLLGKLEDENASRAAYEAALAIQKKLVEQFPAVPAYQQDLARSHNNLGNLLRDLGDQDAARAAYEAGLAIRKKLVGQFPDVPKYQVDLGRSYCNLGVLVLRTGKSGESLELFDSAVQVLNAVYDREPRDVTAKASLRNSHQGRAVVYDLLQRHNEGMKDWDRAIELTAPAERPRIHTLRAVSRVAADVGADAFAQAAELSQHPNWTADKWYNFARIYSIVSTKLPEKQQENADRAMELLRKAVEAGYKDVKHLKTDPDLVPLHERDDFKKLVAALEAVVGTSP